MFIYSDISLIILPCHGDFEIEEHPQRILTLLYCNVQVHLELDSKQHSSFQHLLTQIRFIWLLQLPGIFIQANNLLLKKNTWNPKSF